MSAKGPCNICNQTSQLKCGNCQAIFYCSKAHQKQDWHNHKSNCSSYKIVTNEKLGRHLVSTRTISEGDIILKETPIVVGPSQITPPVCLGCYDLLTEFNKRDCSVCGWPVCSEECEKSSSHLPECNITSSHKKTKVKISFCTNNLPHPSYQCITVLRCLHLKKNRPALWKKLNGLESHSDERKSTEKFNSDELFIAKFIPKFFNYAEFSQEEILKVAGIVQVNAHEIPLREPNYIAVYDKASFLEHNCKANCTKSFTNSGELVIRAAEKILPGDHLSICYTDPLWGRETRIRHLMLTKFFVCRCVRCTDPTEMGTHFNSYRCLHENCEGFAVPTLNLTASEEEPHEETTWPCQICKKTVTEMPLLPDISSFTSELHKNDEKFYAELLQRFEQILHPNHHFLVSVKLTLVDLFSLKEKLPFLEEKKLDWTIKTCRELNDLAITLVPAENRLRGVLLYQLYLVLSESGRRKAVQKEYDEVQVKENLQECKKTLLEAHKLLQYEPTELPEGKMAVAAKEALKCLERFQNQNLNKN